MKTLFKIIFFPITIILGILKFIGILSVGKDMFDL